MSDYTPNALEKVHEAEKKTSTRREMQDTFAMILQPHSNVEDLLCPAPLSIALLGQLLLLSLETDFSLEVKNAAHPPELLNYPGSLRASLLQVSHAGWDAFDLAHKNMDAIRLQTANVPTHIDNAVKIIISGTKQEMGVRLPKALNNVKRIAEDCTKQAKNVEVEFVKVISLIDELLQLCTAKRGEHEQVMKENKFARQVAEDARKRTEEEQEQAKKDLEEMREHFRQTKEDYKKALDEVPTRSFLDKAGSAVIDTLQMYMNPMKKLNAVARTITETGQTLKDIFVPEKGQQTLTATSMQQFQEPQTADLRKLSLSLSKLRDILASLLEFFNAKKDRKALDTDKTNIDYIKAEANRLQDDLKHESHLTVLLKPHLKKAITLITDVSEHDTMITKDPERLEALKKDANEIVTDVESCLLEVNVRGGNLPSPSTPLRSGVPVDSNISEDGIKDAVMKSRIKFEQTSIVMRQAMEQYRASNERNQEVNEKMARLVSEIAAYDMKEIDFEKIRETLLHGINVLGKVKEQWSKLVEYFHAMANIIEITLRESLKDFLDDVESAQELRSHPTCLSLSDLMRDSIYVTASKANHIAYVVHGLSSTYIEVSTQHIMPPLRKLDTYMAMDSVEDQQKIKRIQRQIEADSTNASRAISNLVRKRHHEILLEGNEKIENYEKTMKAALPPLSDDEEAKIQRMKKAAVKPLSQDVVVKDVDGW